MHYHSEMTVIFLIMILVVIPAGIGFCLYTEYLPEGSSISASHSWRDKLHRLFQSHLERGDFLIYRKPKASPRPGPRARNVEASEKGDDYYYEVDKFWTLSDILDDGRLVALTRTGKRILITAQDEKLRKAGLMERLRYRDRFPAL